MLFLLIVFLKRIPAITQVFANQLFYQSIRQWLQIDAFYINYINNNNASNIKYVNKNNYICAYMMLLLQQCSIGKLAPKVDYCNQFCTIITGFIKFKYTTLKSIPFKYLNLFKMLRERQLELHIWHKKHEIKMN